MIKFWAEEQTWKCCEHWEVLCRSEFGVYRFFLLGCRLIAQVQVASLDDEVEDVFVE